MVIDGFDSLVISKLIKNKQKTIIMKKVLAIFAVTSLVALTSCGGSASTETASDSTAVATDSSVVATDSTATATDSTATEVK
jgi:ABC-type oligopeptide transport system substrate-binding subunit